MIEHHISADAGQASAEELAAAQTFWAVAHNFKAQHAQTVSLRAYANAKGMAAVQRYLFWVALAVAAIGFLISAQPTSTGALAGITGTLGVAGTISAIMIANLRRKNQSIARINAAVLVVLNS